MCVLLCLDCGVSEYTNCDCGHEELIQCETCENYEEEFLDENKDWILGEKRE